MNNSPNLKKDIITQDEISRGVYKHSLNLSVMGNTVSAYVKGFYSDIKNRKSLDPNGIRAAIRKCDNIIVDAAATKEELIKLLDKTSA